jgi:hypothetical protein
MYQQTNCEGPPYNKRRVRTQRSLNRSSLVHKCVSSSRPAVRRSWPSEVKDELDTEKSKA